MKAKYSYAFASRRSTVMATHGMVATSQPLATQAGLDVLRRGGNAVDAAIATASVLGVVEPMSTGVGGDMFALIFDANSGQLRGLNGSGRAPAAATVEEYRRRGCQEVPVEGMLSVTVPGALHAWEALRARFGTWPLAALLQPAIRYAEEGFPVSELAARRWAQSSERLLKHGSACYLPGGRAPRPGEVFDNPWLAETLRSIAAEGPELFYQGNLARAIASESDRRGGLLTLEDLKDHSSNWVDPIQTTYRDLSVWELPPNTHGVVVLEALNIVEGYELRDMGHNSSRYLSTLAAALRAALADGHEFVADPDFADIPLERLGSKEYAAARREDRPPPESVDPTVGGPQGNDTVYLTVVDEERNVVSFIYSIFQPFGSGIVVGDTGIVLQNRGALFNLDEGHVNRLQPRKRPYHTLIPGMALADGAPVISLGVRGGFMQPQGHLQLLCNLVDHDMSPQAAIDAPRIRVDPGGSVAVERGVPDDVLEHMRRRGLRVRREEPDGFGGAQAIVINRENGALLGGSDSRNDGCAQGF